MLEDASSRVLGEQRRVAAPIYHLNYALVPLEEHLAGLPQGEREHQHRRRQEGRRHRQAVERHAPGRRGDRGGLIGRRVVRGDIGVEDARRVGVPAA